MEYYLLKITLHDVRGKKRTFWYDIIPQDQLVEWDAATRRRRQPKERPGGDPYGSGVTINYIATLNDEEEYRTLLNDMIDAKNDVSPTRGRTDRPLVTNVNPATGVDAYEAIMRKARAYER